MTSDTDLGEIIEISDSDTDAGSLEQETKPSARAPGAQSAALASDSILVIESSDSEDSGNLDGRSDSNDLAEFNKLLDRLNLNSEPVLSSTPSRSSPLHPTRVLASSGANSTISLSSSDDESSPVAFAIQKGNTRDNTTSTPKTVSTQTRDFSKVDAKLHRDANKLVTDRKATIREFTVEISYALQNLPFVALFSEALASHDGNVEFFEPPDGVERLIRFRRRHIARYDTALKEWIPVEAYTRLEDLYIVLLSADQLARAVSERALPDMLSALRNTHHLTAHSQIFLMIDGVNAYYKRRGAANIEHDAMESSMTFLQAVERCFIVYVDGPVDTSQWLLNITGDLDTYKKMLQQIRGITESAADGIVEEVPTLRSLFEGYDNENDAHARHEWLKEVTISNRKDGVAKSRILNQALSKKVHDVMWGRDPLTLVL
ncbi:hypothetical protein FRC10_011583 [Ceratobasidium sp. 414]|nr:hypothetical protein FRC10_011583 [Ceratobasidium sp. 414]